MQIEQAKLAETLTNDKRYSGEAGLQSFRLGSWVFDVNLLCLHSCQKIEMLLQKITAIHQHYRKDRLAGSMC